MVIPDLSAPHFQNNTPLKPASMMDRFIAGSFDLMLLVPIASFVPSLHIRDARLDYLQGFESTIWYEIILLWVLSYIVVQAAFLYFMGTTPGGMIIHTRVRSLNGQLSWNQCLLRSTFSLFSFFLLGLPFLEVITHVLGRAWHDRVSDTFVIDLKSKPFSPTIQLNVQMVRFFMILGLFLVFISFNSFIDGKEELTFIPDEESSESTDSFVAQALLKKDFSEDTQNEIEDRIWRSGKKYEKSIAYFFKLQVEKDEDVKEALSVQICNWSPSEKPDSICALSKYSVKNDDKTLQAWSQKLEEVQGLTLRVYLMKELTKKAQFVSALKIYNQVKKQAALNSTLEDALKIWDVSLFWALRENQIKQKRVPASSDEVSAIKKYVVERGLP